MEKPRAPGTGVHEGGFFMTPQIIMKKQRLTQPRPPPCPQELALLPANCPHQGPPYPWTGAAPVVVAPPPLRDAQTLVHQAARLATGGRGCKKHWLPGPELPEARGGTSRSPPQPGSLGLDFSGGSVPGTGWVGKGPAASPAPAGSGRSIREAQTAGWQGAAGTEADQLLILARSLLPPRRAALPPAQLSSARPRLQVSASPGSADTNTPLPSPQGWAHVCVCPSTSLCTDPRCLVSSLTQNPSPEVVGASTAGPGPRGGRGEVGEAPSPGGRRRESQESRRTPWLRPSPSPRVQPLTERTALGHTPLHQQCVGERN